MILNNSNLGGNDDWQLLDDENTDDEDGDGKDGLKKENWGDALEDGDDDDDFNN